MSDKYYINRAIRRDIWNYFIDSLRCLHGSTYGLTVPHIEHALFYYAGKIRRGELKDIGIKESVKRGRIEYSLTPIEIEEPRTKKTKVFGVDEYER